MYIFKRVLKIIGFLMIMGVIYAAGAYMLPDYDSLKTPAPLPPPYIPPEPEDPVYTELGSPSVIEYGNINILNSNGDPYHAYICYPQAGNPADGLIYDWAYGIYSDMAAQYSTGVELSASEFGEINVQFDSYLIDNRYAGIYLTGEYSYGAAQQPGEILKTFNIDLTRFELLGTEDILDMENADAVLALLSLRLLVEHPKTDGYHVYMDEKWLSYLLITHEGIKVILPHNEFLPDSFDTLTVLLPYTDLRSLLLIRQDAPLPAMPTPTPEITAQPETSPPPEPDGGGEGEGSEDGEGGGAGPDGGDREGEDPEGSPDREESGGENTDINPDEDGEPAEEETTEPPVPPQSWYVNPDKPTIALSFDDTAGGALADELLDLLEMYGARATFFIPGNLINAQNELLSRAVSLDCEIAGHSWNHKNLAKMSADDVRLQLETANSAIEAATGKAPGFFRPPFGAVSDTMKAVSEELGMFIVKWNIDPEDWKGRDADQIYESVMQQVDGKAIIISHAIYPQTIEAYRRIIPELILQGYQICTVSELFSVVSDKPNPGEVFYSGARMDMIG